MRSRFILLTLAACFVFASVENADARGGKGFRSLFRGSSSSAKAPSTSAASNQYGTRGGENASQAAASYRGAADQRPQVHGIVNYLPPSGNQSDYYNTGPFKPASAAPSAPAAIAAAPAPTASVAAPVPAPVVAAPAPAVPAVAAKPAATEIPVRVASKKYRDPNSSDACPPPFVFDDLNGCRAKGAR